MKNNPVKKIGFQAFALALCLGSGFLSQSCILSVVVPLLVDSVEATPEYNPWDYLKDNCSGDGEEFTFVRKESKPGKNLYYYTSLKLNEKFGEEKEFVVSAEQEDRRYSNVIYQTNYFPYFYEKEESECYLDIVKNKTVKSGSPSSTETRFSDAKVIMNNEQRLCRYNVFTTSSEEKDESGNVTYKEVFNPAYSTVHYISSGNLVDSYIVINPSGTENADEKEIKGLLSEMKEKGILLNFKIIVAGENQISGLGRIDKVTIENVRESSEFCSAAKKVYFARQTELLENEKLVDEI